MVTHLPGTVRRWCPTLGLTRDVTDTYDEVPELISDGDNAYGYTRTNSVIVDDTGAGGTKAMYSAQQTPVSFWRSTGNQPDFVGDWSYGFWFLNDQDSLGSGADVHKIGSSGATTSGIRVYLKPSDDTVNLNVYSDGGRRQINTNAGIFDYSVWSHMLVINEGAGRGLVLYQNGQEAGSYTANPVLNVAMGGYSLFNKMYVKVDDFNIYDHALSQAEIDEVYAGGRGYQPGGTTPSRTFHPLIQG